MAQQDVTLTLSAAPREFARRSQCEGASPRSRRRADRRSERESRRTESAARLSCPSATGSVVPSTTSDPGSRKRSAPSGPSSGRAKRTRKSNVDESVQDCVAHRTRSRSSNGFDAPNDSFAVARSDGPRESSDAGPAAPRSVSSPFAADGRLEGSLFPLEDRDFDYSPFSASTATDLVDSDHSLYTPNRSKNKKRGRKIKSHSISGSTKRQRYETASSNKATTSGCSSVGSLHSSTLPAGGTNRPGGRGPVARPSLIPRRVPGSVQNRTYPLRNRGTNLSSASEGHLRDSSVSSTASDSSFYTQPLNTTESEVSSPLRKSRNLLSGLKFSSDVTNKRKTLNSKFGSTKATESPPLRSSGKISNNNLGARLGRNIGGASHSSAPTTHTKRQSSRSSTISGGECEGLRRSTRSAGATGVVDMPQQTHSSATTASNNKRDKKGKGSLGSCASSGGSSAGGRRPPPTPSVQSQASSYPTTNQQQPLTSSAIASTSNQQSGSPASMGGGTNNDSKVRFKGMGEESGMGTSESTAAGAASVGESSSDDSEVGRLQALLEARGLPPHLLGALGPRMQHLLHRTMGATTSSKATQLLAGLQATGDEGQQLQAVIEMCQLLVMGNEDTLAGFPVRQVVPALITLLGMEHNFDMMNHACRALTYMMEALPHTSGAVALAVPVFLDKLQAITCMDVAEQSLTALDMLSRRHSKPILQARGVSSCLTYLDFFSINAQRAALSITSNCCQNLQSDEFLYIRDSLPLLAGRLTQQDKKSVESVCLAFSRLVDSYQNDPARLQEIASTDLLTNLQQLLVVSPPMISTVTFNTVLRMLSVMCSSCPELAITLLRQNIADTLLFLLTGSTVPNPQDEVELISRSPPELYEITCLIAELMPHLPSSGLFAVDACLERPWGATNPPDHHAQWQWRDDSGVWRSYAAVDSRVIEAAHQNSEDEVSLNALGRTYIVDFLSMKQINEDTGTTRPVQRRLGPSPAQSPASPPTMTTESGTVLVNSGRWNSAAGVADARTACLRGACGKRVLALSAVLLEVYSSSAGPAVRCQCLKALLRMVYHADPDMLTSILKYQVVSSHIAGMMASNDLRIVVGSLQMAEILMQKLPDVFGIHFRREGVMHQIQQLADPAIPLCVSPPKSATRNVGTAITSGTIGTASVKRDLTSGLAVHNLMHYTPGNKAKGSLASNNTKSPAAVASVVAPSVINLNLAPGTSHSSTPIIIPQSAIAVESSVAVNNTNGSAGSLDSLNSGADMPIPSMIPAQEHRSNSPVSMRITDVLKRKRAPKRSVERVAATPGSGTTGGNRHRRQEEPPEMPSAHHHHHHPHGSSFRFRLGGATSKTTSFLASLNPARWGRQHGTPSGLGAIARDSMQSNANIAAQNREKARQWVRTQAAALITEHGGASGVRGGGAHPASGVLARLTAAVQRLRAPDPAALIQLRDVLVDSDISPFEVNHSGLVGALLSFLTANGEGETEELSARDARLRAFLNVFADMPLEIEAMEPMFNYNPSSLSALVSKINACVSQLEQFPVRVHDLPARPSTSALKFFNTHQLKCNLQRHPSCTNLKQWKGGTVKIDPLALVYAIEKYLIVRGYARQRETTSSTSGGSGSQGAHGTSHQLAQDSDDDNSDDDIDDSLAAVVISQGRSKHKLQFLIGDTVLPYNMTVYQAVRQFSPQANDQSETDTDTETPLGNAGVWIQTHTIYYRSVGPDGGANANASNTGQSSLTSQTAQGASGRKGKGTSTKSNNRRKIDDLWNEGIIPPVTSALGRLLDPRLPAVVTVGDAALPALALLRSLHAICRHWTCLYRACPQLYRPLLPQSDFVNSKLAAKANRQLQDPLVIMTGNLPQWLQQIAYACPFLFPLETRQLLFYAVSFDRDRALQRLLDSSPELNHASSDSAERVTPRLDRRKRTISRDHILKQAEQVIQDFAHSKALLEVKYENEVGTGLGPTLEFYALVSKELQRADLDLWHGSENFKQKPSSFGGDVVKSNQIVVKRDPDDSPLPLDPAANLASSVYNNLNLSEEHNRNTQNANTDNINSLDMPMIMDSADLNLNSELVTQGGQVVGAIDVTVNNQNKESQTPTPTEVSYVSLPCGLFPQALGRNTKVSQLSRIKAKFRFLGKFMAKAVMDSRMLDLPFSLTFYRWIIGEESCLSLGDVRHVAPELWRSLCRLQRIALHAETIRSDPTISPERRREMLDGLELDGCPIEELGLDFILPGHSCTELRRGGRDMPVTSHNLGQYISLVMHWLLYEGVNRQMDAFREGFESVFPLSNLKMFYPEELEAIFCGTSTGSSGGIVQRWDIRMLTEACRADHGFTSESRAIHFFLEILSSYDTNEQRLFLQFLTGSPRLPTGGFKSLTPPLTVVRKTLESNVNADDYLPSVMTCVNYLKLPDYSSIEVMRTKLQIAASEGQHSFHLS